MCQSKMALGYEVTHVHMDVSCKKFSGWRMEQQETLDQFQCLDYQDVICSIALFAQKSLKAPNQSHCHVPLEILLELEELAVCKVLVQFE